MNEKNLDYLSNQLRLTGFGENHAEELKDRIQRQTPEFVLFHQQEYGKDNVVASLQFRKSENSDMYFFNRYHLILKNDQYPDTLKQTFFINNKESNITLKEAYNLMSGRAVHKEMTPKEGEKYNAWLQIDFKNTDPNGNYKLKQFHANYGFNLQQTLAKYPIKELGDENFKARLIESLERGNRQSVTFAAAGKEQKIFIEASPQYKSLNFFDADMKRVQAQSLLEKTDGTTQKQDAKKESLKTGGDEEGEAGSSSQKNKRRKGQRVG